MNQPTSKLSIEIAGTNLSKTSQFGQFRLSRQCGKIGHYQRYIMMEIGPGMFPNELHLIDLTLTEGSKIWLDPQSWGKVLPSPSINNTAQTNGAPAQLVTTIDVDSTSQLVLHNAPLIVFDGSHLQSHSTINAQLGSKVIISDVLAKRVLNDADIHPCNLSLDTYIYFDGVLEMVDSIKVGENPILSNDETWTALTDANSCIGTMFILGAWVRRNEMNSEVQRLKSNSIPITISVAQTTMNLMTVRAKSSDAQNITDCFTEIATSLVKHESLSDYVDHIQVANQQSS